MHVSCQSVLISQCHGHITCYVSTCNGNYRLFIWGRIAQSVTCLTADPGAESSNSARSHTFVKIDHEIISMVILLPSADSFKKGCCQLQVKVYARSTG